MLLGTTHISSLFFPLSLWPINLYPRHTLSLFIYHGKRMGHSGQLLAS